MSEQTVVDIEPALQRRSISRNVSEPQFSKLGLGQLATAELLTLATATGEVIVRALERRERMKERRFLAIIMIGLASLVGLVRFMMQLVQS
jgi:hypothetical protein